MLKPTVAAVIVAIAMIVGFEFKLAAQAKPHRKRDVKVTICLSARDYATLDAAVKLGRPGDGRVCPADHLAIELDRADAIHLLSKLAGGLHGNPPIPTPEFPR